MFIPITLLIGLAFICFFLITPYRQAVINVIAIIWNILCGLALSFWRFLSSPVAGTAVRTTSAIVTWTVIAIIIIGISLYAITAIGIVAIGTTSGHFAASITLILILLLWGIFNLVPGIFLFRPLIIVRRWLIRPIAIILLGYLVIACIWWMLGNAFPQLCGSVDRLAGNKGQEIINSLDKKSLKSEPEQGIWAVVIEDCTTYNANNEVVEVNGLKKGTRVRMLNLKGKPANNDAEGMVCVIVPNKYGDYINSNQRWIPSRKISSEGSGNIEEKKDGGEKMELGSIEDNAFFTGKAFSVKLDGKHFEPFPNKLAKGKYRVSPKAKIALKEWNGAFKELDELTVPSEQGGIVLLDHPGIVTIYPVSD